MNEKEQRQLSESLAELGEDARDCRISPADFDKAMATLGIAGQGVAEAMRAFLFPATSATIKA